MANAVPEILAPVAPPPPPPAHWADGVDARIYCYVVLGKALQVAAVIVGIGTVVCTFAVSSLFIFGLSVVVVLAIIGSKLRQTRLWPDNTLYIPWFTERNFIENQPVGIHRTGNNCSFTSAFQFALQSESIQEIIGMYPQEHLLRVATAQYRAAQDAHDFIAEDLEIHRLRQFVAGVARPRDPEAALPIEPRGYRQEDAGDVLTFFLDALEAQHQRVRKNQADVPSFVHQVVETIGDKDKTPESSKILILQPFQYLQNRDAIQPGQTDEQTFVETFLRPYFEDHNDRGDVRRRLIRPPGELIVQISRFDDRGRKINDPLPIPGQFTLPDGSVLNGEIAPHELNAFILHVGGSAHSGHYVAYVKSVTPQGQEIWWEVNDKRTLPLYPQEFEAARKQAYLLLYTANPPQE